MFQSSRMTTRSRLNSRKAVGDENQVIQDTVGTTATAKLMKAVTTAQTGSTHTALKNRVVAGQKASTRSNTALTSKTLNNKRNALGNVINKSGKQEVEVVVKPATRSSKGRPPALADNAQPVSTTRLRTSTTTRGITKSTLSSSLRSRASSTKLSTTTTTTTTTSNSRVSLRTRSSSASVNGGRSGRSSAASVRSRTSVSSIKAANVEVVEHESHSTETESYEAAQPMGRSDSQTTLQPELTSDAMDVDGTQGLTGVNFAMDADSCSEVTVISPLLKVAKETEVDVPLDPHSLEYIIANFEEDIDPYDTTMVPEYAPEIFAYMRKLEVRMLPSPTYMDNQNELEWNMRGILIDWLVQVHHRFRLLPETLFLCVNYIDRFLSHKVVSLEKLQLVGATALLIAAKFEEIQVPSINDFVYMVDNAYSLEEIMKAERFMISMLNFDLAFPGPMSFLRRISKGDDYDIQTRTLAKYLIEVTIMDERFLPFTTSKTAAAGHYLSRRMLDKGEWSDAHVYYSGYTEAMLEDVVALLLELLANPKSHSAIYEKYSDRKFMKASLFVSQWMQANYARLVARCTDGASTGSR
ncbi:B-type cyclin [Dispira simplex]|nr:B-type cyclin [Dispira simplex]